jgi:hypothetical protein
MRTLYFVFMYILLAEASAQYQVEWIFTSGSGKREPFTALEAAKNGVLAGTYNGKIYYFNDLTTPEFSFMVPHAVSAIEVKDQTFISYGTSIRTFNFKGQELKSDTLASGPRWYSFCETGFYGLYPYKHLSKHTRDGKLIWSTIVDDNANNMRFAVGKSSIYVYTALYSGGNIISRYDTSGTLIWRKGAGMLVDQLMADEDGNFYLFSNIGYPDGFFYTIYKFNENAELLWESRHPSHWANGIFVGDSLILCGGSKNFEGLKQSGVMIISKANATEINEFYVNILENEDWGENFTRIALVGKDFYCSGEYGEGTPFLVKLSDSRYVGIKESAVQQKVFTVFPNPSSSVFTVKLAEVNGHPAIVRVSNSMGQLVLEEKRHSFETEFDLNLAAHAKGFYFVEIKSADRTEVQKIILE